MSAQLTDEEALNRVASYCSTAEHCRAEINEKLQRWGIAYDTIARILDRLESEKFIDDERFCRAFVNDKFRFAKWGKMKIAQGLYMKKIPSDVAWRYLNEIDEEEYFLTIDKNGWLCAGPLVDYFDIEKSDKIYIDLDTGISDLTIDFCLDEGLHVTVFATDDDCDGDCESCELNVEDKNPIKKESTTTATYTVNGKKVSEDEYHKKLEEMDEKFQKHIQAVLDEYNDFIEDSKALKKLFN